MSKSDIQTTVSQSSVKVLYTDDFIASEPNEEKAKIYQAGNLCYKRNLIVKDLRKINYFCDCFNKLRPKDIMKKSSKFERKLWKILCIIFLILWSFFALIFGICYLLAVNGSKKFLIQVIVVLPVFILICVLRKVLKYIIAKMKLNRFKDKIINPLILKADELKAKADEYENVMRDRNNCIIPQAYWDYGEEISKYIYNSRADNLKEALNTFEIDRHNYLMRQEQQKQSELMRIQNAIAQDNYNMLYNINRNVIISNILSI